MDEITRHDDTEEETGVCKLCGAVKAMVDLDAVSSYVGGPLTSADSGEWRTDYYVCASVDACGYVMQPSVPRADWRY